MAQRRVTAALLSGILLAAFAIPASEAGASTHHKHHRHHSSHLVYTRPQPASYVVDADTGFVLESENADAPRYPASLTKMMTLYLTFEALKKGALSLDDAIPVSEHAASQPQTNIALVPGERIAVKDAILSIVVRSANDSAVALGEALGRGSEEEFARRMTAKAHALGMTHTVFYNASGLPNPAQHTTARDMCALGLALRKNFPQYFPFFKTESFTYRGLTYVTHNHVMMRYEGVDGIKTGFIRASGYNLVTSATRGNHHIVASVLGGTTFRARDDKMISLLDHSFADLSTLPGNRVQLASSGKRIPAYPVKVEGEDAMAEGEGDRPDKSGPSLAERNHNAVSETASDENKAEWAIQVGAFAKVKDAQTAAANAIEQAPAELNSSSVSVSDEKDNRVVHRARLVNLTQNQAEEACHKLTAAHSPCFAYHLD